MPRRDKVITASAIVMSILFLLGTLLPGYALIHAPLPRWFAALVPPLICWMAWNLLISDPQPRFRKLLKTWNRTNPELASRLKEVMTQAAKDPDGIGYFGHALNLIRKDPECAALLEGLYYRTINKSQLRLALGRERFDGMSPELIREFDTRLRIATYTDLQTLFGTVYVAATIGYLAGIILYMQWTKASTYFSTLLQSSAGRAWIAPTTLIAILGLYVNWSKNRPASKTD